MSEVSSSQKSTDQLIEYDDGCDAMREGWALRPARAYRFRLAVGDLSFRTQQVNDPVPLGRQILASAGLRPLRSSPPSLQAFPKKFL